jgi:hypothetical protein
MFSGPQHGPKILPSHVSPVAVPQNPSSLIGKLAVGDADDDVKEDVEDPTVELDDVVDNDTDELDVLAVAVADTVPPEELTGIGHGCTFVSRLKTAQFSRLTQLVNIPLARQASNAARLPIVSR